MLNCFLSRVEGQYLLMFFCFVLRRIRCNNALPFRIFSYLCNKISFYYDSGTGTNN